MIETLTKLGFEGIYPNIIKAMCDDKPAASIILNTEQLEAFPLRAGTLHVRSIWVQMKQESLPSGSA